MAKFNSVTRFSLLHPAVHKVDHVLLVPEMPISLLLAYRVSGGLTIISPIPTKLGEHSTTGSRAAGVMTFLAAIEGFAHMDFGKTEPIWPGRSANWSIMPDAFLQLSDADRREALEVAAAASGRPVHLLEKDVWSSGRWKPCSGPDLEGGNWPPRL